MILSGTHPVPLSGELGVFPPSFSGFIIQENSEKSKIAFCTKIATSFCAFRQDLAVLYEFFELFSFILPLLSTILTDSIFYSKLSSAHCCDRMFGDDIIENCGKGRYLYPHPCHRTDGHPPCGNPVQGPERYKECRTRDRSGIFRRHRYGRRKWASES